MTNSSNPKSPKNSRKKPAREPATIDLKATVIDEGAQQEKAWDAVKPEDTIVPEAPASAQGASGDPESVPDSGHSADSIESATTESATVETVTAETAEASGEAPPPDQPLPPQPDLPPEDPQSAPPGPPPAPERRIPVGALIGSGLLGGLLGAGLVYGLGTWQPRSNQDDQRLAQLEQRVTALGQSRPGPQPEAQNVDLSPIESRLQELEAARGSLDQRLQEIQEAANRAAARAEEAFNRPLPEPAAAPPQDTAALDDLSGRIAAAEEAVRSLEGEVRTGAQSAADASGAVQDLGRRLGEQDQRLEALSRQVADNSRNVEETGQTGIRIVLVESLDDALRSGAPYADVLDGLRKTGADAGRLKALEPFAEKGAPTASAMLGSFEPLEAQILREERVASGEWSDRVLRMLDKVVTVRPVNEPGATGVSATVARIRQALSTGDMEGAASAWASLPEPARRISEEWGRQATALAEAQRASRELTAEALAALNRSTQ